MDRELAEKQALAQATEAAREAGAKEITPVALAHLYRSGRFDYAVYLYGVHPALVQEPCMYSYLVIRRRAPMPPILTSYCWQVYSLAHACEIVTEKHSRVKLLYNPEAEGAASAEGVKNGQKE